LQIIKAVPIVKICHFWLHGGFFVEQQCWTTPLGWCFRVYSKFTRPSW